MQPTDQMSLIDVLHLQRSNLRPGEGLDEPRGRAVLTCGELDQYTADGPDVAGEGLDEPRGHAVLTCGELD